MPPSALPLPQLNTREKTLELEYGKVPGHGIYAALSANPAEGSAVLPFGQGAEGSTVFLPFRANLLIAARLDAEGLVAWCRVRHATLWSEALPLPEGCRFETGEKTIRLVIPLRLFPGASRLKVAAYAKELDKNHGWGRFVTDEPTASEGFGDQTVRKYSRIDLATGQTLTQTRLGGERARIYQLFPRLFSNTNPRRQPNGTLAENGVGKFEEINDAALSSLRAMGFTHLWLTGILRQATATDYSPIGLPADPADLLKGLAGSPYAIKDLFDLCPDYAQIPENRFAEFQALAARARAQGLKILIDFVPNHVARSYESTVRPSLSFGAQDDATRFCHPENNFFHLHGQALRLPTWKDGQPMSPTCQILGTCTGVFEPEAVHARVTGNNVASPAPSLHDWYETIKLNYGFNFTTGARAYPHGSDSLRPIPSTWLKMDQVLAYWQELGVDGFRCDMAHMVPPEFWAWAIGRAKARNEDVFFFGEAYDRDPMKVPGADPLLAALDDHRGNVMFDLLSAGFDAVYDDPSYKALKSLYEGSGWANDLDGALGHPFIFENSLRYAENHDEVRLSSGSSWGNAQRPPSETMRLGQPVCSILFGLSRGPLLVYNGQEVGEPALGHEGFSRDETRTSIFDYWSMPELMKWVNGHRFDGGGLSPEQTQLREFYARLLRLTGSRAFAEGEFFPLNPENLSNERYGRLPGESTSGHWLYTFLRHASEPSESFLVVANLHRWETLRDVHLNLSPRALRFLELRSDSKVVLEEKLTGAPPILLEAAGAGIKEIPPLTAYYFEFQAANDLNGFSPRQ